jgi:cytochrome c
LAILGVACLASVHVHGAQVPGDATRGARFFGACAHCHSIAPGEHHVGPSLAKVYEGKAASVPGFTRYSEALRASGKVWDAVTLDKWIEDPAGFIPGSNMAFPGVRNPRVRADLVAYLKAVADGKAPPRFPPEAPLRIDLSKAPPEGRVRSITLCKGVYAVETADGHLEKVPESALRFRTDSSELGPAPGKPVAMGADRGREGGFIIFATPAEISGFIRQKCE